MDKQAIENELKSIVRLFKACTDKNYLIKLCSDKGILDKISNLKKAKDNDLDFSEKYARLVKEDADTVTKFGTVMYHHNIAKTVRPKSDPTQDALLQKQKKEINRILKDNEGFEKKPLSKNLGKVWDKAFIIEMEKRYGTWDSKSKSFLNDQGQALVKVSDLNSIQDYVYSIVSRKIQNMPRGWTTEDFAEGILAYMFYPSAAGYSAKDFYDYVDTYLEQAKESGNLPLEVGPLLKRFISDRTKNFIKFNINKQFADEVDLENQIDYIDNIQRQINDAKREDQRDALIKKLENAKERLKYLQDKVNKHKTKIDDASPGAIPVHPFVKKDVSQDGEVIEFTPDKIDFVGDVRDAIEDIIIKEDLVNDFTSYLKQNADDKTFRVFKLVIENDDLTLENKKEIRKFLELEDAKELEISDRNITTIAGKLRNHLAEYALDRDDPEMLKALDKMNLLPERYKIKKSNDKIATIVSYIKELSNKI